MSTPGFTAETSLYRTSVSYRSLASGSDHLTGGVVTSGGWMSTFGREVTLVMPFGGSSYAHKCGALGEACCRAPFQNVPAFGPLVSCQQDLGCDITTGKCVSPCGGPGQPCCDGPETRAPKWTADGRIYSPNSWNMREMCEKGACDRQTHRCFTCGTQEGSPCCPPDAANAMSHCIGDSLKCEVNGTCHACGSEGRPPCSWGCDQGLNIRNGLCGVCGGDFQPPCDKGCNPSLELAQGLCRLCPPPRVDCNHHCCELGWSCTKEGCCPPGVCCESTACPPGKSCCGGKICCRNGTDCRPINGTSEYGCFR